MKNFFYYLMVFFIPFTSATAQDSVSYNLGSVKLVGETKVLNDSFNLVDRSLLLNNDINQTAEALNLISGVIASVTGNRNESVAFVRGFDLRQVPLLLDGIPVYVPFDGYVDLARFTVFDLESIEVQKGTSSISSGPNALGGSINMVSAKPTKRLETKGMLGLFNGGHRLFASAGTKKEKYYSLLSFSQYQRNSFSLSQNYDANVLENGGNRDNSFNQDWRVNFKFGFTPNKNQEHVINFIRQEGEKGNPLYAGNDSLNPRLRNQRFWYWPFWNKTSLYYLSNLRLGQGQKLHIRAFYDQFDNRLESYDDATQTTQNRRYAFSSVFNDRTFGGNINYINKKNDRNTFIASGHLKYDLHRETDVPNTERRMSDYTAFIGVENEYKWSKKLSATAALSYNFRQSEVAQDQELPNGEFTSFAPNSSDAVNGRLSLDYQLKQSTVAFFNLSRNSRFATIKDRYSYRLGTAVPNPDLLPEQSNNFDLGLKTKFKDWYISTSVFYNQIENSMLEVERAFFDLNDSNWLRQIQNVGEAQFYGFELDVRKNWKRGLETRFNYSFIERENLSNPDVLFTQVPNHTFWGMLAYRPSKKFRAQLSAQAQSESNSTTYGVTNNAFVVGNMQLAYNVTKVFSLRGSINNILDTNYTLVEGFPEPGRNFMVTLLWNYGK